ncbi:Cation efflux protein transmembrane domain [Phytophthora cactorum]|nr:Cation efflux protein transmembrane domain [Phytophthora cactorum]
MERKASRRIPLTDGAKRAQRKLQLACVCSLLFMCAEVVGGFLAGSLAIMTDAAHLLSDVAGFCISLFAIWVSTMPASKRLSFGFQRAEVIGAVTSVLVIWVLTGVLVYAAVERFMECLEPNPKEHVNGKLMFIVACIGLVVNLILMQILGHGTATVEEAATATRTEEIAMAMPMETAAPVPVATRRDTVTRTAMATPTEATATLTETWRTAKKKLENLNIEAAYIHALGDFIQSIGVCIAGGLIWYKPEWQIADPIATFIFSILVLGTTIGIVRDSIHVLMEGTPDGIHADEIERGLLSDDAETALHAAQRYLMSKGITHTTIQIEKTATLYPRDCNSDLKCGQDSPQNSD